MDLLLENISQEDLKKYLKEFYNYAKKELKLDRPPRLFLDEDQKNADDLLGKTGFYDPENEEIHLFITDRHGKDIIRSFSHELVHHAQKLAGFDNDLDLFATSDPAYATNNPKLREMERDAFERGNMIFRDWTDSKKIERGNKMLNEKKGKMPSEKTIKDIKKGMKKHGQHMTKKESIKDIAKKEAKENVDAIRGKKQKYMEEEEQKESCGMKENKNSDASETPYPQLFDKKQRLMQDMFNKREDIIYQELIRRFIKK